MEEQVNSGTAQEQLSQAKIQEIADYIMLKLRKKYVIDNTNDQAAHIMVAVCLVAAKMISVSEDINGALAWFSGIVHEEFAAAREAEKNAILVPEDVKSIV